MPHAERIFPLPLGREEAATYSSLLRIRNRRQLPSVRGVSTDHRRVLVSLDERKHSADDGALASRVSIRGPER